jgi:hypothetical protein
MCLVMCVQVIQIITMYLATKFRQLQHDSATLENRDSTWWTSNTTLDMQRCARQEESMSAHRVASLTQLLKVPHLANWRTFQELV